MGRFSPLERRRMEREIEEWKGRAEKAEITLIRVSMIINETVYLKTTEK